MSENSDESVPDEEVLDKNRINTIDSHHRFEEINHALQNRMQTQIR